MMLGPRALAATLLVFAIGPVNSQGDRATAGGTSSQTESMCFSIRDVRNVEAFDDRYLMAETRYDRYFLLTMEGGCTGLQDSESFAISNALSRVCSSDQATVRYSLSGQTETCQIREVEEAASEEAAEELAGQRAR